MKPTPVRRTARFSPDEASLITMTKELDQTNNIAATYPAQTIAPARTAMNSK